MNWSNVIAELQAAGWSQPQIAAECGCAQSTISDLAGGRTKDPRYTIGEKLKQLADRVVAGTTNTQALPPTTQPAGQGVAHA